MTYATYQTTNYSESSRVKAAALLELRRRQAEGASAPVWQPNADHDDGTPNPQRLALESKADEVFYGGQAGGGKTDLLVGAALTQHRRSAIFRRVAPNLDAIEQRILELVGADNYNLSRKVFNDGQRRIELESCQLDKDKTKQQGRPRDLLGFDEITEFTSSIYKFIIGWLRTTEQGQRTRVICAGNPPIDVDGAWVIEEWGPWLDDAHPTPQEAGALMWYTYDAEGRLQWSYEPRDGWRSRTFIPATLADNPHLATDGKYQAVLNSMPEPLRSAFRDGDFKLLTRHGNPFQVIPLAWIRAAQKRWLERERPGGAPDCVGHDVSRGGRDATTSIGRWDDYFDILGQWPGVSIQDGPTAAAKVQQSLRGMTPGVINVDVIGYGASSYDSLVGMGYNAIPINVSHGSTYRDKSGKLSMRDLRTELVWRLRDALDPDDNSTICLPPDPQITSDLCCYIYKPLAGGKVAIKSKEDIKKELGRSPDIGDGLLLANYRGANRGSRLLF